jgi:hypothetical protein
VVLKEGNVMKSLVPAALLALALVSPSAAGEVPKEAVDRIQKVLADAGCKPGEIEADDTGYRVDDAECADGQNDIKIDKDFKITSRRKE